MSMPLDLVLVRHGESEGNYTRQDPDTGEVHPYVGHMRLVCPWNPVHATGAWERITRPRYTNAELLKTVERVPRMIQG